MPMGNRIWRGATSVLGGNAQTPLVWLFPGWSPEVSCTPGEIPASFDFSLLLSSSILSTYTFASTSFLEQDPAAPMPMPALLSHLMFGLRSLAVVDVHERPLHILKRLNLVLQPRTGELRALGGGNLEAKGRELT